ncbi:type VI secretion system-associated protein TagF [Zooshikella sp. RANM57]|uniref:type VI secretion system-associated protein TagF n=1 Tax=Zooshikella sp. RANM57 TaxID=3425863 RepID=UPI003D6E3370
MLLTGFYGKFPTHGDFISRRLPREFLDHWDEWLQGAIRHSQNELGNSWLNSYLSCPVWRFLLSDGVCGEGIWHGLLIPSVDRVGRYFPLTFVSHLQHVKSPMRILAECGYWLDRLEDIAYTVLDDDFDFELMEKNIKQLGNPRLSTSAQQHAPAHSRQVSRPHLMAALEVERVRPLQAMPALAEHLLNRMFNSYSLWWTHGSEHIAPALLCCEGLPSLAGFTSFMTGQWEQGGWINLGSVITHSDSVGLLED